MNKKKGKVWLVGAGPGDVGLLTIKAKKIIESCDTIVYDKLVGQGVLGLIPKGKKCLFVGKVAGNHAVPQEGINKILLDEALEGKNVCRLKGGDPFLFGRGGEELELLIENEVEFEIVPGITSAIAVPAYNGIPVTHRDFVSSLHIITGHTKLKEEAEIDYEALVKLKGTLVFLMGTSAAEKICSGLLNAGMPKETPTACLSRGTRANQKRIITSLDKLAYEVENTKVKTPAIIMVGDVCSLSERFEWAEKRPLGTLKIAVTRPLEAGNRLAEKLSELGAEVVVLPTIETVSLGSNKQIADTIKSIEQRRLIAFTSAAGVRGFFENLFDMNYDVRVLCGAKFAVVGPATKNELKKYGIIADMMPEIYTGKELGKLISENKEIINGTSVLLARGTNADEDILTELDKNVIQFDDVAFYETRNYQREDYIEMDFQEEEIDFVTFTSASTVDGFVKMFEGLDYTKVNALCIGDKTAMQADKYGMNITVSEAATIDSMIEKILQIAK